MVSGKAKTASEHSAATQARLAKRGGGRFPTLTLDPDENALWERLVAVHGGEGKGTAKRTLIAALRALESRSGPSKAEVLAYLDARLPAD